MKIRTTIGASALAAIAGMAVAQPTLDGVYTPGTEGSFYSDLIWVQDNPTAFGDNSAGLFSGGEFGNPEAVTTGVEIKIPLASLGLSGTETIKLAGWVNSGDRTFLSNQIIGALPLDTNNIGGAPDFNAAPFDTTSQYVSIDLSAAAGAAPTIDGTLDNGYVNFFTQGNYTGFGNETDGTVDGSGPNGGGSEIDGVFARVSGGNLYLFVTGNLETNGNAIDLYFDTTAGGDSTLGSTSGDGGFIASAQSGLDFDTGFAADYLFSVDSVDDDADGGTVNVPRAFFGGINDSIADLGNAAGYGSASALSGGVSLAVNNSNTEGVIGSPSQATPASPDADWAYGSELDNARVYIDEPNNTLWLFLAGNMEGNYNKLVLFFDSQPGGQSVIRDDNVDISFNGLNSMSNIAFDAGFSADYWIDINQGVDGGTGMLQRYTDAATMRTEGALIDPFFGVVVDYGSYDGGNIGDFPTIPFAGPRVDLQDGSFSGLYANYAPRLTQLDPMNPLSNLLQVAINNSNVAGVTDSSASGASAVNTGIEIAIDLDELGWDGEQDIKVAGWIVNSGFDYISNQVLGGIPGSDNVGPRDADSDGINDLDWSMIDGDQFLNLSNPVVETCAADLNGDGIANFFDVSAFLTAFNNHQPAADFTGDGIYNFFDVSAFLSAYGVGCP